MSSLLVDRYGAPVAGSAASVAAWDGAWHCALHFTGDAFAELATANETDDAFALGSVFCGTYRILGGAPPDVPEVRADLDRAVRRAHSGRDMGHLEALRLVVAGEFTRAGQVWDEVAAGSETIDLAAIRFAHDVWLHVADAPRRVASSRAAYRATSVAATSPGTAVGAPDPLAEAHSFARGQLAFALEEVGDLDEAEALAAASLDQDPRDLWALHALAHVYETADDHEAATALFRDRFTGWTPDDSLALHVHWHHALRMIAAGDTDAALNLHDELTRSATTAFRLCDLTSILWRLELAGVDVGDRWLGLADAFAARPERHTNGFLDLHMALAFLRCPRHAEAAAFFRGVGESHPQPISENDRTFREVVTPLVEAVRCFDDDPAAARNLLDATAADHHRIGGSNAQRDLIALTRHALEP